MPRPLAAFACACAVAAASCAEAMDGAREAEIVAALTQADQHMARSRPALVAGKYDQMAANLYAFHRGSFPLFVHDVHTGTEPGSRIEPTGPLPLAIGDAHPENFGTLLAGDGTLALEPNDLDAADRWPATWDLRRLLTGLVLFARLANAGDETARAASAAASADVARAAARAYADVILADTPPRRVDAPGDAEALVDLFDRARDDARSRDEITELTRVEDGARRLVRGPIDEAEPWSVLVDLPAFAGEALPAALDAYRRTLVDPPASSYFRVLDAARQLGSGIASWPRIRVLVLVEGPSDATTDDVILELKELAPSGAGGWIPSGVSAADEVDRVVSAARQIWAEPDADPLWGGATWLGMPAQIRAEREAHKTIRLARMEGELGTSEALGRLAATLGALLARVHGRDARGSEGAARGMRRAVATSADAFVAEQVEAALASADRAADDWALFARALDRLGPTLGIAADDATISADLRALIGIPPVVSAREP